MITNAIRLAQNEHTVYFLLTSYLDARGNDHQGSALPEGVKRLPIAGKTDVDGRLRVLSDPLAGEPADGANVLPIIEEAASVLRAASERIASLQGSEQIPKSWNVVERTRGGHVRRRRLGWRMTEHEAAQWAARKRINLEPAD